MKIERIWAVYFSPTGGTKKVVTTLAKDLAQELQKEMQELDLTKPENREKVYPFSEKDLVIVGTPVYAGRVPNKLLPDLEKCLEGNDAAAIPVSVYGNRSFGDALMELKLLLQEKGFRPVGAAAVVSRHAFSDKLAAGRPDEEDMEEMHTFAKNVAAILRGKTQHIDAGAKAGADVEADRMTESNAAASDGVSVPGNQPVGAYYIPLQEDGTPAKFLKAKPITNIEKCRQCGICAAACPMGSIDVSDAAQVTGVCIKCQACVRICPQHAKHFTDEQFLSHVRMLEKNYTRRAENYFFPNAAQRETQMGES